MPKLRGAIAAAVTPFRDGGRSLDLDAIPSYTAFLVAGGVDGVLVAGTTGEGILLSRDERRSLTEAFVATRPEGFAVAVHAGAQTTAGSVALAGHAVRAGADAVAVIAPPYYPLDDEELFRHLAAAAAAAEPLPFYVYSFAGRSGYPVPPAVVDRLRGTAQNLAGMKVSDTPFSAIESYLGMDLDVFAGSEPLVLEGLDRGCAGAVSGLAAAFPSLTARLVHDRDEAAHQAALELREGMATIPFAAGLKEVLVARDVLPSADVRSPLRGLTDPERGRTAELAARVDALLAG